MNVSGWIIINPSAFRRINPNYQMGLAKESSAQTSSGTASPGYGLENEDEDLSLQYPTTLAEFTVSTLSKFGIFKQST